MEVKISKKGLFIIGLAVLLIAFRIGLKTANLNAKESNKVLFEVKVGNKKGEIDYQIEPEVEPWGPSSFAISPHGNFYINDGVNREIDIFSQNGKWLATIPYPDEIVGIGDIIFYQSNLAALDLASQPPKIVLFDLTTNKVVQSLELEPRIIENASGLSIANDGSLAIKQAENKVLSVLKNKELLENKLFSEKISLPQLENLINIKPANLQSNPHQAEIEICSGSSRKKIRLLSDKNLGCLSYLGCDKNKNLIFSVEEFELNPEIEVKVSIKKFDLEGNLLAEGFYPLNECKVFNFKRNLVTHSGKVYAMVPKANKVSIEEINFEPISKTDLISNYFKTKTLILFKSFEKLANFCFEPLIEPAIAGITEGWSRNDANNLAWNYYQNSWYCSYANYARSCPNNIRPRYITSYNRYYPSVPYKWGGYHTISQFNSAMNDGKDAGDIETSAVSYCTYGVDCSGFVSRLWQLGEKRSTYTIDNSDIAFPITNEFVTLGDILNKPGSHVVFVRYISGDGVQTWESTMSNSYDRIVTMWRSWANLSGYKAYRYRFWSAN